MQKTKFFEFVIDHQEREDSEKVLSKDKLTQLKEDIEEGKENGKAVKAARLFKSLQQEKADRLKQIQTAEPLDDEAAEALSKQKVLLHL